MLYAATEFNRIEYPEPEEFTPRPKTIEEKIEKELGLQFLAIARCESGNEDYPYGRQFKEDGTVLVSPTSDVGALQINQVHWERASELGIDIYTLDGNIAFAKLLKGQNGTADWYMSEHCWSKQLVLNTNVDMI